MFLAGSVLAAPAKVDPVAEGYPDWQGAVDKNHIAGRFISGSDMRHKVTVVIDIDGGEGCRGQLLKTGDLVMLNGLSGFHVGDNWETRVLPRNVMVVISCRGAKDHEAVLAAFKAPKGADENVTRTLSTLRHPSIPIYEDITFTGAPDTTGKRPFVYVMGAEGKDPIFQGELNAKNVKLASAKTREAANKLSSVTWEPFYGSIPEPQFHPAYKKTIEKGKLTGLKPLLMKSIVGKDAEKAKEAQILYDAMEQTRSDLALRIMLEAKECPHRAAYDMQTLFKFWPAEKKKLDAATQALKANPEAGQLVAMFPKLMVWADPKFVCKNASDAKKIVAELTKFKKTLEKLKESKNITVQNGALTIDTMCDELIATIPNRVPEK